MKNIIIIGGGPAGIMTAISASRDSIKVELFEKNTKLGKKLLLTGKGRCNLTNMCDVSVFIDRFSKSGRFLRDAFKLFFNGDLISFFKSRGLNTKVERQNRVFPVTDKSLSVLQVLTKELLKRKVNINYNSEVKEVLIKKNMVEGIMLSNGKKFYANKVVIATGGISYPSTGSTGDGFQMASKLGHSIVTIRPALIPLEIKQRFTKVLMGLTLKNIRLTFCRGKKRIISDIGELLFTDFGVSGPLVLSLSGQVVDMLLKGKVYMLIDLKPALSEKQIEARLIREIKDNPKMIIKNLMKSFLPAKLAFIFLDLIHIDLNKKVSNISAAERRKIVSALKAFSLDISKARPMQYAMVTKGGVSLKELNPKTMESRIVKGLYFAGEVIDVEADTGGFNLQAAFSTGFLAGKSI